MKTKLLLIVFYLIVSNFLIAQIIHVPEDQPTIQDGINAANDGDTVLVAENTYFENINFKGKAITVASNFILDEDTLHINNTIIDGSQPAHADTGSVVSFISGEDTTSVLFGLTITKGSGTFFQSSGTRAGGGIVCRNSGAKIIYNNISENEISDESIVMGGGIAAGNDEGNYWMVITNNIVRNNNVISVDLEAVGGGIEIQSNAKIQHNTIEQNQCYSENSNAQGGGVHCLSWENSMNILIFQNNVIQNNHIGGTKNYGGGVYVYLSKIVMSNNVISNNYLSGDKAWGGGLCLTHLAGEFCISGNEISNNTMSVEEFWVGCGVYINEPGARTEIIKNVISSNSGTGNSWGGGVYLSNSEENEVIIDGNIFYDNTSVSGGGLYAKAVSNCMFTNNMFFNNTAEGSGGAVFLKEPTSGKDVYKPTKTYYGKLLDSTHFAMINNTFANNIAASNGGAVCCNYIDETINIINSIFWENEGATGTDVAHSGDYEINISYSNIDTTGIEGLWTGSDNMNEDPLFFDPENGDFHIQNSSPCAGGGIDSLEVNEAMFYCPAFDFENDPRPMPISLTPDMGADEVEEEVYPSTPDIVVPITFSRLSNYPNPFTNRTTIELNIQQSGFVRLSIIDFTGKEIQTLISEQIQKGIHQFDWNAKELPAGIYFLRLEMNGISKTRKLVILK